MKHRFARTAALAVPALALLSLPAAAQPPRSLAAGTTYTYTATDLGTLGGHSVAVGINKAGQIIGHSNGSSHTASGPYRAVLWDLATGSMRDLHAEFGFDPASSSYGRGINNLGQIAGHTNVTGTTRAFVGSLNDPGQGITFLGTVSGGNDSSQSSEINDSGQVVGRVNPGGYDHAFLWQEGAGMVDLGVLGGVHSGAHAINNRGQVVGNSNNGTVANRAFLWTPGATDGVSTNPQMKDLGTLGGPTSQAYDINDDGVTVGVADTAQNYKGNPIWHAYRWIPNSPNATTGRMESLGFSSVAEGINNLGEIVGGTQTGGSFRWVEGVGREVLPEVYKAYAVQDVDPALSPGAGGKIVGVKSIVGADGLNYSRAYLLTPDLPTADSPAAPANLSAPSKTTTSVTLAWNYTGTAPTAGFRVDYKGPNGSWIRSTSTVSPTASGYTVTVGGLTSGTLYYFRVRAENAVAAGKTISHFAVTSVTTASSTKTR